MSSSQTSLDLKDVVKRFSTGKRSRLSIRRKRTKDFVTAVDRVSFKIGKGETIVLLGESGSGKTTLGRLIVGLDIPDSGTIEFDATKVKYVREKRAKRGQLQMVFQDPGSSLDPFMKVLNCVAEPLKKSDLSKEERVARSLDAMKLVGLEDTIAVRKASELSGGQKQRVAIARAIASEPSVIVLDEPTSSIDVSVQAQVLNLLIDLQSSKGFTYVLITHDPNVARYMADYIAVMYLGRIVEYGKASELLTAPKHPYTRDLLASRPILGGTVVPTAMGEPGSLINLPPGCRYEPRCKYAMAKCRAKDPDLIEMQDKSRVACYLFEA
jgi:peptide/nickel transport system ATP-binding protein